MRAARRPGSGAEAQAPSALLDPDVLLRMEAGSKRASTVLNRATTVAGQARRGLAPLPQVADLRPVLVNGTAGVVTSLRGRPVAVIGFTVTADRIAGMDVIANPRRVRRIVGNGTEAPGPVSSL